MTRSSRSHSRSTDACFALIPALVSCAVIVAWSRRRRASAWTLAGVASATGIGEDAAELIEVVRLQVGRREIGIEALARPGKQAVAVEGP